MHDSELLEEYVTRNSEAAFQSLVARYLNLVRSTALRQVRNVPLAEDVAQAVFILLARKAGVLSKTKNLALSGWLYRTTRFVAAHATRGEMRRQWREQEALAMQQSNSADETWRRIAPLLDEGIEQLNQIERNAVLLRFFQDEPLRAVGLSLGISEEAARKRVNRSLEKLRAFFVCRGFTISVAMLGSALAGQRAEAAPAGLANVIGTKALTYAASSANALPVLVAGTLQAWRWATLKMVIGIGAAATALIFLSANTLTSPAQRFVNSTVVQRPVNPMHSAKQNAAAAAKPFHFSFRAVDDETGRGIARARVLVQSVRDLKQALVHPPQLDLLTNLQTDADGRCAIELPYSHPLMITVGVVADGYMEKCVIGGDFKPVPDDYTFRLLRGSILGGVVEDESGQPVSGAAIQISCFGTGDYSDREWQRERPGFPSDDVVSATTDSAGRWSLV